MTDVNLETLETLETAVGVLKKTLSSYKTIKNSLEGKQSSIELALSDAYHALEFGNLSGKGMLKLSANMKKILVARRNIKEKHASVNNNITQITKVLTAYSSFVDAENKKKTKSYKPRKFNIKELTDTDIEDKLKRYEV